MPTERKSLQLVESCEHCRYHQDQTEEGERAQGYCRRFPPVLTYTRPLKAEEGFSEYANNVVRWDFPLVEPDCWCGEFVRRVVVS